MKIEELTLGEYIAQNRNKNSLGFSGSDIQMMTMVGVPNYKVPVVRCMECGGLISDLNDPVYKVTAKLVKWYHFCSEGCMNKYIKKENL